MHAAEEWSGSPEQADDMTVIVMRFSAASAGATRVKVLTAAQMREADRLTTERYGIPSIELMENAGSGDRRISARKISGHCATAKSWCCAERETTAATGWWSQGC